MEKKISRAPVIITTLISFLLLCGAGIGIFVGYCFLIMGMGSLFSQDYPVVSLGKDGFAAYLDPDGKPEHFEAVEVNSIDTTAAGDIFLGALSSRLAAGSSFAEALQFANAAASLSTAAKGAQTSIPELDDVLSLMGERRG